MSDLLGKVKSKKIKKILLSNGFFPDSQEVLVLKNCRANGEGSIRQKGNGYEGRITVGFDNNGRQVRKSVYAETRKECNDKMLALREKYKDSLPVVFNEPPYLLDWVAVWVAEYKTNISVSTRQKYNILINKIRESDLAEKKIDQIKPIEMQQFVNSIPSYDLAKRMIGLLKEAMLSAVENGYIQRNIASTLRNGAAAPAPKFEETQKAFTPDEETKFLDAITDSPYRLLYLLSLYGGLRRGEACAMTWESIDLNKRIMRVKEAATRSQDSGYESGKTKTARSVRTVPISDKLFTALSVADKSGNYVFHRNGRMLNPDVLTMDFGHIMKQLGMKHTLHQLRHTFATRCFEKGINIKVVQSWMGHVKSDMTLDIYTHATEEMLSAEAEKLN